MDLQQDKQKIYSIEAEYYKTHIQEVRATEFTRRLNKIIKLLLGVLFLLILFFSYKTYDVYGSKNIELVKQVDSTKRYLEELASFPMLEEKRRDKEVVLGVSVLASDIKDESNFTSIDKKSSISVEEEKRKEDSIKKSDEVEQNKVFSRDYLKEVQEALEHIEQQ